jgi:hypothetical protein
MNNYCLQNIGHGFELGHQFGEPKDKSKQLMMVGPKA